MSKKKKPVRLVPPPVVQRNPWIFPAVIVGPLFLLWGVIVLYCYLGTHPFDTRYFLWFIDQLSDVHLFHPYMGKVAASLTVAIAIAFVIWSGGEWILKKLWPGEVWSGPDATALGGALGVGSAGYLIAFLGAAHLWYTGVLAGILGALVLLLAFRYFRNRSAAPKSIPLFTGSSLWIGLVGIFLFLFLVGDLTPETFYDALYYHIAVPDLYRMAHRVYNIPTMLFSNFVLTLQFFFGWGLTLGTAISAKLLHGFLGLLLLMTYLAMENLVIAPGAGWLAALILFSMPITILNITTTGTDVGWAFLQAASALAFLRAFQKPSTRAWIAAGVLTGLSAGCKYPGFPYIPIAGIVLVWTRRKDDQQSWNTIIKEAIIFLGSATAMVIPVLARNAIFHQNPLYPFGGTRWGTPRITPAHWQTFVSDANSRALGDVFHSSSALAQFLFHPWYTTMQGQGNSDFVGPLFLLLLPLLFIYRSPRPAYKILRRYTALLWLLWMCTSTSPRYGLPALALASVLMAEAVLSGFQNTLWRWVGTGLVLVGVVSNLNYAAVVEMGHQGWRVLAGQTSESDFLSEMRQGYPTPPYSAFAWMNEHLGPGTKILIAGEARSYYSRWPTIPSSVPDPQPLVQWSKEAKTSDDLVQRFRQEAVTHIFLNFMEATRTESYHLFDWDPDSWARFQAFWNRYVQLVWKDERLTKDNPKALYVYAILSDEQAALPHTPPPNPFERWAPKSTSS